MQVNNNLYLNPGLNRTERTIFKLISTLSSLTAIQILSSENRLVKGLKKLRAVHDVDFNQEIYKKIVYPKLGITPDIYYTSITEKQNIALSYASILKKYRPNDRGQLINSHLTYFEIVSIVNEVFKNHMQNEKSMLFTGIQFSIENTKYYAKAAKEKIYIISAYGTRNIGKGSTGNVWQVFDLASQKLIALKLGHSGAESFHNIYMEVANLNKIHRHLAMNNVSREGIQDPILAEFNLPDNNFVGYLNTLYEQDLKHWILQKNASPLKRIRLCKLIMKLARKIQDAGLWHGDVKPNNIMLKNKQPIIIDWAGAILFSVAKVDIIKPYFTTTTYTNKKDLSNLQSIINKKERCGSLSCEDSEKFISAAKSIELFSFAITLFKTLTSKSPFQKVFDKNLGRTLPKTKSGISIIYLKDYSDDITHIMKKMLAHDPKNRYSAEDAYAVWENIDENTGKFRSKVYQLT